MYHVKAIWGFGQTVAYNKGFPSRSLSEMPIYPLEWNAFKLANKAEKVSIYLDSFSLSDIIVSIECDGFQDAGQQDKTPSLMRMDFVEASGCQCSATISFQVCTAVPR
jgi:hypothetical protein